jgi:YcxB-like protein
MAVASFKFTPDYLIEGLRRYRRQHRARWLIRACKVICGLLSALLAGLAFSRGPWPLGMFFVALCVVLFLAPRIDDWVARRSFRKSPYQNDDFVIELTESGVQTRSQKQDAKLQWPAFTRVVHFRDGFLLFQGPRFFNWIPARALAEASQVAELEALLRLRIREHRVVEPVMPPNSSSQP